MKILLSTTAALLALPSLRAQGLPEAAEPNNTTATAALLPLGLQAYGDIDNSGTDEDWFQITLAGSTDLKVWTGPGFAGQIGDTRVRLYAADGVTVLLDIDDGNSTTHGYYTTFSGNFPAGTYYVAVRGYDALTFGSYTLDVVGAAPGTYAPAAPPLSAVAEGPENNDPRPTFGSGVATPSGAFTRNLGAITAGGSSGTSHTTTGKDYDFYAIAVPAPGTWTFSTLQTTTAPAAAVDDTVLHVLDAAFTRLAFNDDFGGSAYSQLSYNFTTPGTYYVAVSGYYGTSAGNYYLDVLGPTPPLPTGTATTTMVAGGCVGSAGTPVLGNRLSSTGTNVRPERLVLGSEFWLDGTDLPSNAPLLRLVGFGALAVPFDLTGLGAPGCLVEVDALGANFALADGAGVDFWSIATPSTLVFIGLPIQQQLAVLDAGANALGLSTSNRVASVAGILH
jgi:hypothetical protein